MSTYIPTTEIKIVGIEVAGVINDIGAARSKALPAHCRIRYHQEIIYVLENGERVKATISALTKPKLKERFESTTRNISNGYMSAYFRDGKFEGTTLKMLLSSIR